MITGSECEMTKSDVIAGARGKPVLFEFEGFRCLLRPLSFGERSDLFAWSRAHGEEPGSGLELQTKVALLGVCDEKGAPLLEAADLREFDGRVVEAISSEVARRNGVDGKAAGEPGKGASPTTTS